VQLPAVRGFASGGMIKEYNWQDPLNIESRLTEEEQMIRDVARKYSQVPSITPRLTTVRSLTDRFCSALL